MTFPAPHDDSVHIESSTTGITKVLCFAAGSGIAPIRAAIESEELGLGKASYSMPLVDFLPHSCD